jgi:hypothetical protein
MTSNHADLLNALNEMQGNLAYALRRSELRAAERLIVAQEKMITDLLAACKLGEKCLIDLAPYSPDVAAAVVAIVDIMHAAIAKAEAAK